MSDRWVRWAPFDSRDPTIEAKVFDSSFLPHVKVVVIDGEEVFRRARFRSLLDLAFIAVGPHGLGSLGDRFVPPGANFFVGGTPAEISPRADQWLLRIGARDTREGTTTRARS